MIAPVKGHIEAWEDLASPQRQLRAGYRNFKPTRFNALPGNVGVTGTTGDYHLNETDYYRSIEIGRSLDRENVAITPAITRLCNQVLRTGFDPEPRTGNDELDMILEDEWGRWAESKDLCDAQGERSFKSMSKLAFRHIIVDGDIMGNPLRNDTLQMLEGHRCRSSSYSVGKRRRQDTVLGVRMNRLRKRLTYYITREDVGAFQRVTWGDVEPYSVYNRQGHRKFFHAYFPKRLSQTRGVTATAPIIPVANDHDDINLAMLIKQKVTSAYVLLRKKEIFDGPPEKDGSSERKPLNEQEETTSADGWSKIVEKVSPGVEIIGEEGESLEAFNPDLPVATFFDHMRLILTYISINLNIPLIVLLMDGSETNFSGWRGAMELAKDGFIDLQHQFIGNWHRDIYLWRVRRTLATNPRARSLAMQEGVDAFHHAWKTPGWPYIEPMKDAGADLLQWRNCLNSMDSIQAARGRCWEDVVPKIVSSNSLLIEQCMKEAARLKKAYPDFQLDWREVMSPPTPDNVNAWFPIGQEEQAETGNVRDPKAALS